VAENVRRIRLLAENNRRAGRNDGFVVFIDWIPANLKIAVETLIPS